MRFTAITDEDKQFPAYHNNQALYVTAYVNGREFSRALLEGDAAINIMPISVFKAAGGGRLLADKEYVHIKGEVLPCPQVVSDSLLRYFSIFLIIELVPGAVRPCQRVERTSGERALVHPLTALRKGLIRICFSSQAGKPAYSYSNVHWSFSFLPAIWLFYLDVCSPVLLSHARFRFAPFYFCYSSYSCNGGYAGPLLIE